MFTWICPQCGREVPPSYNDCPDCAEKAKAGAAAADAQQPAAPQAQQPAAPLALLPPPPVQPQAPVHQPLPPPPPPAQVPYGYAPAKRGLPGPLVALLVALVLVGLGAAGYYYLLPSVRAQREAETPEPETTEPASAPTAEAKAGAPAQPGARLSKFVEVTGLRILEVNKKAQIRYLIVNHSAAELAGLEGSILLRAGNAGEPLATVPIDVTLGPWEAKDISAPLKTKLRAYELPDWQFLKAEVQLKGQ